MTERANNGNENRRARRPRPRGEQPRSRQKQAAQVPPGYLAVGVITGAHGIRGEVTIEPYTDFPDQRFAEGESVLLGQEMEVADIITSRPHKGRVLVRFGHIEDRDEAEALRGVWIYIPETEAADLEDDTYFIHQILGLSVHTEEGQILGTIKDVLFTGANEVYVVEPSAGLNRGREVLIPAIGEVVQSVDLAAGVLTIRLMPGILEAEE
jgi:16S rRNA processing protein RimM